MCYVLLDTHQTRSTSIIQMKVQMKEKKGYICYMGCFKMDISDQYFTALKVVKETSRSGKNTRAGSYRFGFNGQEKEDEISGVTGSHLNFKYRLYDSRTGRFYSIDPIWQQFPYWTPYQFAGLTPIQGKELEGLEVYYSNREWGTAGGVGQKGWGYVKGSGTARDDVGITYFKYKSKIKINDNESVMGLQLIYAKKHFGVDLSSNTFEESIHKAPVTSVDVTPVFGGSIDGRTGDTYVGGSVSLGIGAAHTTFEAEITESFSFTKEDRSEVRKLFAESGHYITNEDKPEYYEYKKEGQSYLGYRLPRSLLGLGLIDISVEIKTDIKLTNVSENESSIRWQTERYKQGVEEIEE